MKIFEVLGTPDSGKTTALKSLSSLLKEMNIPSEFIIETRGKDLFPKSMRGSLDYNIMVGAITCSRIQETLSHTNAEIVLVDKGYVDYLFWVQYYLASGKCTKKEADEASNLYGDMGVVPNRIIGFTCSPEVAAIRCKDPVETRTVQVSKHNDAFLAFFNSWNRTQKSLIDTSFMTKSEVLGELSHIVLS